jgi:uncharacterized membrane protein
MRKWYPAALVVLSLVISIIAFGHLPDPMPIHWDIQGRVNGYGSRWMGAFLTPLVTHRVGGYLMAGLGVLLVVSAALAPAAATFILVVGGVVIVALGTIIYSYVVWRQEKRA